MVFPIPIPPTPRRFGVTDPISLGMPTEAVVETYHFSRVYRKCIPPIGDDLGIFLWHWHVSWVYKVYTKCIIVYNILPFSADLGIFLALFSTLM